MITKICYLKRFYGEQKKACQMEFHLKESWYEIIQDRIDVLISDEEFLNNKCKYTHNTPEIKEAYYYRKIFEETFKNRSSILPYWRT